TFLNRLAASAVEHDGVAKQSSDLVVPDQAEYENEIHQSESTSDDECNNQVENNDYLDEGVVGGLLSQQWSIPSLDFIDDNDDDDDDDMLDCLDVDFDM
ncbi:hypothetical protein EV175_007439, partial [Coemansia sp. RSA 1933]